MKHSEPKVITDQVQDHYATLAPRYTRNANAACLRAYRKLVTHTLKGTRRVLELGAGATPLSGELHAERAVACDLSLPMLQASNDGETVQRTVCDAQMLPFPDAVFDAVFSVNLLEHTPNPERVLAESARVLVPGGRCLMVTPNGDVRFLLDVLERLHLKLPEGPHRFLRFEELNKMAESRFRIVKHRRFLAFPAGPDCFVNAVDRLPLQRNGWGLFQYILLEKGD